MEASISVVHPIKGCCNWRPLVFLLVHFNTIDSVQRTSLLHKLVGLRNIPCFAQQTKIYFSRSYFPLNVIYSLFPRTISRNFFVFNVFIESLSFFVYVLQRHMKMKKIKLLILFINFKINICLPVTPFIYTKLHLGVLGIV